MSDNALRRGLRLGFAVAGLVAATAFVAPVSAQQAPAEVAAVAVFCRDAGYDLTDCTEAIKVALIAEVPGAVILLD